MVPIVHGKPHVDKKTTIDLERLSGACRLQTSIFAKPQSGDTDYIFANPQSGDTDYSEFERAQKGG